METRTAERAPLRRRERSIATLRVVYSGEQIVDATARRIHPGATAMGRRPKGADHLWALDRDPLLSRTHATLRWADGALSIVDRDSRNGTSVNGRSIVDAKLRDGDLLRLADTFLVVRIGGEPQEDHPMPELSGRAPAMAALRRSLAMVARTEATAVLLGESGAGKGQSARALHRLSGRSGPLVPVNCAAIPEALAESSLFGHRAGAFTGARRDAPGLFRAAEGGTLFIDELGELPSALQAKLLHAIEERAVTPVGGTRPVPVDARVIAATNADIRGDVRADRFRGDLWARLSEIVLEIPPLRDRREDILSTLADFSEPPGPEVSPELAQALLLHDWPYNVRGLRNVATELAVRGGGAEAQAHILRRLATESAAPPEPEPPDAAPEPARREGPPDLAAVTDALRAHRGVVADAARSLGRSRRQLYRLLSKYGIDPDDYRGE